MYHVADAMKKTLIALVMTFGVFCLPFVGAAEDEKVLNIYNWANYIDEETIPEFEKQFGVKVNYDVYDGNETLLAKLMAGGSGFDLIFPSQYMVEIMIKLNLAAELDKSKIPNAANIDPKFLNQFFDPSNKYSLPYTWGGSCIGYRADKLTETVDSWNILFDPKHAGQIVVLDDMREVMGFALKSLGFSYNSTNPEELEQAKALLIQQKPLIKAYSSAQPEQKLLSGDAALLHNFTGDTLRILREDPEHIKIIIPKEGASMFVDSFVIPANAPHKELAHEFINFMLDPQRDARIHNRISYPTTNAKAAPYLDGVIQQFIAQIPPEAEDKMEYIKDLGEATRLWDKIWTEIKAE